DHNNIQFLGVNFKRRRILFYFIVHNRLGCALLVGKLVAVTAVSPQNEKKKQPDGHYQPLHPNQNAKLPRQ
ncbi:hypothetical protein ACQWBR_23105, partial [Salmonella enterica subsp. enterica serovar Infantis]